MIKHYVKTFLISYLMYTFILGAIILAFSLFYALGYLISPMKVLAQYKYHIFIAPMLAASMAVFFEWGAQLRNNANDP